VTSALKILPSACGLGQHFQDLGHSFSLYGPPSRQIIYIYLVFYFYFFFILQLANFVSDLGGSLGLWIGMSVLSFAEIFELLLLVCLRVGRKLKNGGSTKSSTTHVEEFKYSS